MYNKKTLNRWNMTEDECEKAIRKIRIPNMRLTYAEKEDLFFFIKEGIIAEDDIDEQISHVEWDRNLKAKMEADKKLVREFAKNVRRLEKKYDCFNSDLEDKSLDELTEMWINNYFELYFMEDHLDSIKDKGAKEYAEYYLHIRGVIPSDEVSMWK